MNGKSGLKNGVNFACVHLRALFSPEDKQQMASGTHTLFPTQNKVHTILLTFSRRQFNSNSFSKVRGWGCWKVFPGSRLTVCPPFLWSNIERKCFGIGEQLKTRDGLYLAECILDGSSNKKECLGEIQSSQSAHWLSRWITRWWQDRSSLQRSSDR
jgi:hypothetical protein